jgi:hypothetical protein
MEQKRRDPVDDCLPWSQPGVIRHGAERDDETMSEPKATNLNATLPKNARLHECGGT